MSARPMVFAICLTADRQAMTDRAVRSFLAQTYTPRRMLILDSGVTRYTLESVRPAPFPREVQTVYMPGRRGDTIGALRNAAADLALDADILMHWDSDDWSSPHRMLSQALKLQRKADSMMPVELAESVPPRLMVGYNAMVFWDSTRGQAWEYSHGRPDYGLGTSLAYWRETWLARRFGLTSVGEEIDFSRGRCVSQSAIPEDNCLPMLVAEIHGGNTAGKIVDCGSEWRRAPERDEKIGRLMQL